MNSIPNKIGNLNFPNPPRNANNHPLTISDILALEFRLFIAEKSYLNIQSLQIVQTMQFYLEVITLLTSTILDQGISQDSRRSFYVKEYLSKMF